MIRESLMLKKIQDFVQKSDLSKDDKADFVKILLDVNDEELENLAALFSESSAWVSIMWDNYKNKKVASEEKSEEKWNQIVADEKAMLKNM